MGEPRSLFVSPAIIATSSVIVCLLAAAPAGAQSDGHEPREVASVGLKRPFKGIRFFYVPSQQRYRAVKFSPRSEYYPAGYSAGAFSSGKDGDSCFRGQRNGSVYVGTLYSLWSGPQYTRAYTLNELFLGEQTYSAPRWFKKKARGHLNGNNVCAVW